MRLFSFLSLRQWLTLPYTALVFGVVVLIGTLSYRTGSQAVDTIANHLLLETVARIGQAVDRHIVGSAALTITSITEASRVSFLASGASMPRMLNCASDCILIKCA